MNDNSVLDRKRPPLRPPLLPTLNMKLGNSNIQDGPPPLERLEPVRPMLEVDSSIAGTENYFTVNCSHPSSSSSGYFSENEYRPRRLSSVSQLARECNTSAGFRPTISRNLRQQENICYADQDNPVVLCVANFPFYTTKTTILKLFDDFRPLDVEIVQNAPTGDPYDFTYALVTVLNRDVAEAAIFELDNVQLKKRILIVKLLDDEDVIFEGKDDEMVLRKQGEVDQLRHTMVKAGLCGIDRSDIFLEERFKNLGKFQKVQVDDYETAISKKSENCVPLTQLFVDNIPQNKSRREIFEEFSKLTIELGNVILHSSLDDEWNPGFCFLAYKSEHAASVAMRQLSTGWIKVWGHDLFVDWAENYSELGNKSSVAKVIRLKNVADNLSEKNLRDMFGVFGTVENVKKCKSSAFVYFESQESAACAVQKLRDKDIGGAIVESILPEHRQKEEKLKQGPGMKTFYAKRIDSDGIVPGRNYSFDNEDDCDEKKLFWERYNLYHANIHGDE